MTAVLLHTNDQIDQTTGFRYRRVYLHNEGSRLHRHDYYEVFLTLCDDVKHTVNGETTVLPMGALLFIRKEDTHFYESSIKDNISFVNFAFTEEILHSLFQFLSTGYGYEALLAADMPPMVELTEQDTGYIISLFDDLNALPAEDIPGRMYRGRMLLLKLFTKFFSLYQSPALSEEDYPPQWLTVLDKEMHKLQHFSQGIDHMIQLSGHCHTHLGRVMKKHYGQTITEYINTIRLQYWANSLTTTNIPVLELCYTCGFNNISWAYALFKEKYGVPPAAYRKLRQ